MLTKLWEDIIGRPGVVPLDETTVLPTDTIIVQIANNTPETFHRLQIIEVEETTVPPKLIESEFQNPAAVVDLAPSEDGTMSCLSPAPDYVITCAGGTSSAYFELDHTDLFDVEINDVSYVNITIAQLQELLAEQQVDFVPMKKITEPNP